MVESYTRWLEFGQSADRKQTVRHGMWEALKWEPSEHNIIRITHLTPLFQIGKPVWLIVPKYMRIKAWKMPIKQ